jgi:hypothetical protein
MEKSRELHPTQKFRRRRDGKTILSMTVRGTTELRNWILSLGRSDQTTATTIGDFRTDWRER